MSGHVGPEYPLLLPCTSQEGRRTGSACLRQKRLKADGDRQTQFKKRAGPLKHRRHDNSLMLVNGTKGKWTPHDLRRTAATMMQALSVLPDIIDRCQNHVLTGSRVRRHYLHHDYADEKRAAWAKRGTP
jgi:integrase